MKNITTYGAVGDGVTDDTTAIQNAINACDKGEQLFFPVGDYRITSALSITKGINIVGESQQDSKVKIDNVTSHGFHGNTLDSIIIDKLLIYSPVTKTAGAAVYITAPSGTMNKLSVIKNCTIADCYDGIKMDKSVLAKIEACYCVTNINDNIFIANVENSDSGDDIISNCTIDGGGVSLNGIKQESSGGLRIINNKILGNQRGFYALYGAGVNTSILIITGNSIEGNAAYNVLVDANNAVNMHNIAITGNQMNTTGPANVNIQGAVISQVAVTGNTFVGGTTGTYGVQGISLTNMSVVGNEFTGGNVVNFAIVVNTNNVLFGPNIINGPSVPYGNHGANTRII